MLNNISRRSNQFRSHSLHCEWEPLNFLMENTMVNSCQKGKRGEREARDVLNSVFGTNCRRGQQFCGGHDSPDIAGFIPGIHIEVKNVEKLRLSDAIEQSEADSDIEGGEIPTVMWKKPRTKDWYLIVKIDNVPALGDKVEKQLRGAISNSGLNNHDIERLAGKAVHNAKLMNRRPLQCLDRYKELGVINMKGGER